MGFTALKFLFTRISAAPIPSSVRNLQSLRKLDLGRNSITGVIPSFLSSLVHLKFYHFLQILRKLRRGRMTKR